MEMESLRFSRREMLRASGAFVGAGVLAHLWPGEFLPTAHAYELQQVTSSADRLAQMRQQSSAVPLQTTKLRDNIYMLSGPGGNMVVLSGSDGKVLVDSSYSNVAPKIKAAMDGFGPAPFKMLINTHWHIDHTDGNEAMHEMGAVIVAHENTRKRLSTPQDIAAFGLHFDPSPAGALPTQTFAQTKKLRFSGEQLTLQYFPPAHTDSDIYIHYAKNNVLHMGDVWFNGTYPFIDASSGGNINGMIAGTAKGLTVADADTKIVPGHGPLGDKAALTQHHEMLVTVRDRVQRLKSEGKSQQEAVAAKPTADLDDTWGKGSVKGDTFVTFVYSTL